MRDRTEEAAVRRDRAGGRRAGGRRAGGPGSGWDASGLRSLAVHTAIVGLAGVFVLAALLLAALAGLVTAPAQPSASTPAGAVPSAAVRAAAVPSAAAASVSARSAAAAAAAAARSAPGASGPAASVRVSPAASSRARVISAVTSEAGWRARTVTGLSPLMMSTAVGPSARAAYELVARRPGGTGPFRLWRIGLPGGSGGPAGVAGAARRGPAFPVSDVSAAGGFVWVSGDLGGGSATASSRAVLYQVRPRTLAIVAAWRLPSQSGQFGRYAPVRVAAGPARRVWVGFGGTLRQLNTRTGAIVRQVRLPAGLLVSDIAVDPAGRYLYVAGEGQAGGVTALEYAAATGHRLAVTARSPLRFSVGGAALTAVPGGVWVSFRTGMLGQAILLRQPGLGSVPLPSAYLPGVPPASVRPDFYSYAMDASTSFGGGALWLSQGTGGLTGCVAPRTGQVRSAATLRLLAGGGELLGVRASAREVVASGPSGLIIITPPARCWS
jgi:hypothetical protein